MYIYFLYSSAYIYIYVYVYVYIYMFADRRGASRPYFFLDVDTTT